MARLGHEEMIEDGQVGEHLQALVGAGDASASSTVRRQVIDRPFVKKHRTSRGGGLSSEEPEDGGLPRSVRTDQADELASFDLEAHVVDCGQPAESLGEPDTAQPAHRTASSIEWCDADTPVAVSTRSTAEEALRRIRSTTPSGCEA